LGINLTNTVALTVKTAAGCDTSITIIQDSSFVSDFSFLKTLAGSGGTSQVIIDNTKFTTSDNTNCPVIKFIFTEITVGTQALS
jgi:hypothetical protein